MKNFLLSPLFLFVITNGFSFAAMNLEESDPLPVAENWCPVQVYNEEECTRILDETFSNSIIDVKYGETICFNGDFKFTGTINSIPNPEDESKQEITIKIASGSNIIMDTFTSFTGNWSLFNYSGSKLELKSESFINNGQSFYNNGEFLIQTDVAFNVLPGGYFCNSGTTYIGGDIVNSGLIKSSGSLESGNEFKNNSGAEAWITDLKVQDEITNVGDIFLAGVIESFNESFKNTGNIIGLPGPCSAIKAKKDIENKSPGIIDGELGSIAIGIEEDKFDGYSGGQKGDVFFSDSGNISEDCFRILPVIFNEFEAILNEVQRTAILTWSTSKEWENSHFEIQRSLDGAASFENVAEVAGMGWTDELTEYAFEDNELPLAGGNVFYRLKQVDFNGKYKYSEITAVRVPNIHFTKGVWRAYPNPNRGDDFQLELVDVSQYQDEAVTLRVLSSTLSSNEMTFKNLYELNSSASSIMGNAPNGLWIIELQWGNKVERIKVMKK